MHEQIDSSGEQSGYSGLPDFSGSSKPNVSFEDFSRFQMYPVSLFNFCDGYPQCNINFEDEFDPKCDDRFRCEARYRVSIDPSEFCDGTIHCDDGSDEWPQNCPHRFYCNSSDGAKCNGIFCCRSGEVIEASASQPISISNKGRCDFIINCDNGEDEMNCTNDGRFYCENGNPQYVTKRQVFDGRGDCSDFSDECPLMSQNRDKNIFSSRYHLIANPILRGIVWLMGFLALAGNLAVIMHETKFFLDARKKKLAAPTRTNHLLILNLAVADFLMGIYLLMLGIAGATFDGIFCAYELTWRSGLMCQIMGVLIAISSETSVVIMVLLASFRLFAVLKPFEASAKPSRRSILSLILSAWFFSFLLALLPISPFLQFMFENSALIENEYFFRNVSVRVGSAKIWAEKLLTYDPIFGSSSLHTLEKIRNAASWKELQSLVANSNVAFTVQTERYFGYYSINSVCIPRMFVTCGDSGWQFSISISIFNFIAFFLVACFYAIIIKRTRMSRYSVQRSTDPKLDESAKMKAMQKKIYRLVATDFCCWVPISIMAFVNFSGFPVSDTAYVISAIVLLPINSALNTILYTDVLDKAMAEFRIRIFKSSSKKQRFGSSSEQTNQKNVTKL